jgi:hypothetical protein
MLCRPLQVLQQATRFEQPAAVVLKSSQRK